MRNHFWDWIYQAILLVVFCGAITLMEYCTDYFELKKLSTTETVWVAAAGWVAVGALRMVFSVIQRANTPIKERLV